MAFRGLCAGINIIVFPKKRLCDHQSKQFSMILVQLHTRNLIKPTQQFRLWLYAQNHNFVVILLRGICSEKCSLSRAGTCVWLPLQNSTTDSNHNWETFAVNMRARRQTRVRTQPFAGLYEIVAVKHRGGKGGEWQYELFADVFSNIQETILPKALGQLHPSFLNSVCMNRWVMALLPTKLPYYEWPSPTCHIYTTVKKSTRSLPVQSSQYRVCQRAAGDHSHTLLLARTHHPTSHWIVVCPTHGGSSSLLQAPTERHFIMSTVKLMPDWETGAQTSFSTAQTGWQL